MYFQNSFFIFILVSLLNFSTIGAETEGKTISEKQRNGKIFPVFQVYRFRNTPCVGGSKNGTCYTSAECSAKGGTAEGSCASNFGVCCTFTSTCGSTTSENCTYFESTGPQAGSCPMKICKCSDDICQLRLDFNQFVITGPSTASVSVVKTLNGLEAAGAAKSMATNTQCLTDIFTVTNPGGISPPAICGTNTGEHMYVDAAEGCNDIGFQLGSSAQGTAGIATRQWSIKISQYSCNYENLAPSGCTQYFFGSNVDTVQTYNFAGGHHLANQQQQICVRRERGNCRICWTAMADTDFAVSAKTNKMAGVVDQEECCGYGNAGVGTSGFDCLSIPGAFAAQTTTKFYAGNFFCGRDKGLPSKTNVLNMPGTVCSDRTPFYIRFISDQYEHTGAITEATNNDVGFRLTYIQSSTNC